MIKEKVKYSTLLMLLCCMGWVMTGCGDDKDEPTPPKARFSHVKAELSVKVEGETTRCFDISGTWTSNGVETAMEPLKINAEQTFKPDNSKTLPSTYSMTLDVTPNKDFVPEEGKKYNAKLQFSYSIRVIGTDGSVLAAREGSMYLMNLEGIRTDKLTKIAARVPKNFNFTVKQSADGSYEITN